MQVTGQEFAGAGTVPGTARAPEPVISARGLVKRYGGLTAVDGVDLEVNQGEIFAFLGPNGAGKTTTVEVLEGFRPRTAGEVSVFGVDPAEGDGSWRNRVGTVLQESQPEPGLTVRECLELYAGYYRSPRDVDETLELVGLGQNGGTLGERLSGGQRRRLDVALALVGDPDLIFLDEPTTGFDPSARRGAWDVIAGLRRLGKTVFLTTHYMDEAESLADRVAVIAAGSIVAEGRPDDLAGRHGLPTTIQFTLPAASAFSELPATLQLLAVPGPGHRLTLRSHTPVAHVHELSAWAIQAGLDLPDLEVRRPTLEEVYLTITDKGKATQ